MKARLQQILTTMPIADNTWAVPTKDGILFAFEQYPWKNKKGNTVEFIALDGKVVVRSDSKGLFAAHGRLWTCVSLKKDQKVVLGAVIKSAGGYAVLQLKIEKGVRIPVGYMAPDLIPAGIKESFGENARKYPYHVSILPWRKKTSIEAPEAEVPELPAPSAEFIIRKREKGPAYTAPTGRPPRSPRRGNEPVNKDPVGSPWLENLEMLQLRFNELPPAPKRRRPDSDPMPRIPQDEMVFGDLHRI